jgi:hypothetical protein
MNQHTRFFRRSAQDENDQRYPPRWRSPQPEPGQDFATLTANHGRPFGPFETGRKKPYDGAKPDPDTPE